MLVPESFVVSRGKEPNGVKFNVYLLYGERLRYSPLVAACGCFGILIEPLNDVAVAYNFLHLTVMLHQPKLILATAGASVSGITLGNHNALTTY